MAQDISAFLDAPPAKGSGVDAFLDGGTADSFLDAPAKPAPSLAPVIKAQDDKYGFGPELSPDPFAYHPSTAAKLALRIGLPLGAAALTGGAGLLPAIAITAGAGGAGELAAQGLEVAGGERPNISLPQLGTATILSGFPGLPLGRVASPLARGAIRVAEGAGLGASAPVIESGLQGKLPQIGDVGRGALFGAALGVPFGALEAAQGVRQNILNRPAGIGELQAMSDARAEAVRPIPSTDIVPTELDAVGQSMREIKNDALAGGQVGVTGEQVRMARVAARMAGKPPEQARAILDQEVKLAGDTLTPAEERVALEAKQKLDDQIEQQNAVEDAQKAQEQQAKAVAAQQKQQQQAAAQAAEPPKSAQILAESQKPPSIANVATEIGTQTSPYALQEKLGQLTAPPEKPAITQTAAPAQIEAANIGPRDTTVSTGDGVPTAKEQAMLKEQQRLVDEHLAEITGQVTRADANAELTQVPADIIGGSGNNDSGARKIHPQDARIGGADKTTLKMILEEAANDRGHGDENLAAAAQDMIKEARKTKDPIEMRRVLSLHEQDSIHAELERRAKEYESDADAVDVGEPAQKQLPTPRPTSSEQRLNDAGSDLPPISGMSREAKRAELDAAGVKTYNGKPLDEANPAQISAAVGKLRRGQLERGAVNPSVLSPIVGSVGGAAYGATQGNSPEERIRNAALYGALGLGAGSLSGVLINKALSKPLRNYTSTVLKDTERMLTPIEEKQTLFEKLADKYNNFRYHFNTRFAPIGGAQRTLYKEAGKTFTPNRYYDLERGFERLSGAPVQAEGEVELLQNIIDKLPKQDVPHLDTYLTLSRIEDRLLKTSEENDRLMDGVGRAQAEFDLAQQANKASPTVRSAASVVARREELNSATKKLQDEFNRKRVGDWSIAKARQGLTDLQSEIGPDAYARLQQAGSEYQKVMQRSLKIQVESGRMSQDLMDRVLASNDFYAPFKVLKYYDDADRGFVKGGGARIPSSEQLAKKITGIDDLDVRIGSPTDVSAEQIYKGFILAQKNRKLRELATLAKVDPNGQFVKPLGEGMDPRKGYEAVTYFSGGDPKRIEVAKPIADALTGLDLQQTHVVLGGLSNFAKVFKLGATGMNATFNIANAGIFDPLRLATLSRYGIQPNIAKDLLYTAYEWPRALLASARGNLTPGINNALEGLGSKTTLPPDELYEMWMRSGAANSTLARQLTPESFSARLPKDVAGKELFAQANSGLGAPIKLASLVSNTLEETTKILGLSRAVRLERLDTMTPAQIERKWPEIINEVRNYAGSPDFARIGVDTKPLNIIMPFLNARWQGTLADFARLNPFRQGNAADAGAAWARIGSLVALPTAALTYYNLSTPQNEADFLKIPKQERDRYFHIPLQVGPDGKPTILDTGKGYYFKNKDGVDIRGYYRIPKRELPQLIGNTVEDFVQYVKAEHPESLPQLMANLADNTAQSASPVSIQGNNAKERGLSMMSGLNPALRLPMEVALNKNFYTGQPIVPADAANASPEKQFSEQTPQIYKDAAGAIPDSAPEFLRSPATLQHVTEGLTGGFSRQFAAPHLSPGNPAGETSPILGRFYRSERVENEDLLKGADEAIRGRADQRLDAQRLSSKLADIVQSKSTPEEKQKVIADAASVGLLTKDVVNFLKEDIEDAQRGLSYEDRVIKRSYTVAGEFRAKYYLDKIRSLPPGEANAYLQDQKRKGLLTKEVMGQMQAASGRHP